MSFGKLFITVLILLLGFSNLDLKAQTKTELDYFEANQFQEEVLVKWAISKGSTCNGITITRSSDSLYFETIGRIEGVCGNPNFQQPYSFVDEAPLKNQKNYYKLELGTSEFSEVISIFMVEKGDADYQIRPHPIKEDGRIYFDNPFYNECFISVYHISGSFVQEQSTREAYFDINTDRLNNGFHVFRIINQDDIIEGKFIVIH